MRLFIAIEFENEIIDVLTRLQEKMKAQGVSGNYTRRENLHLTLAFIGEYGNPDDILDAMERVSFKPFSICLDGVGNYGQLFWAGIKGSGELDAYVKRLRWVLADMDIPFDRKRFSPHITLIRKAAYGDGKPIPSVGDIQGEMNVRRISLMRSERGKHSMVYTEIGYVDGERL